ncbi:MAG: hypothetical protein AMJ79_10075 [Phycisphaerae bacterium SM23_30]|nr:MAG: hypothetical protein AMJ79_10075 [Phycisphaerae bacterium SM23_30]
MEKNDLINIWKEGNQEMLKTKIFTRSELEDFLRPKVRKATLSLNFNIFVYMAVLLATMVLIGIDLYGYRSNPIMLKVLIPMFVISSSFFGYGVFLLNYIHQINRNESDLMGSINKKLKVYRTHYEIWMWMMSISLLFLIFALNSMVDNDQGTYRINRPYFFAIMNLAILLFIYGVQKVAQFVSLKSIKVYLKDLQNEALEGSCQLEEDKKRYRIFAVILVIIFTGLLIWGIIKAKMSF